ncbi:MAG: PaaI family thioesterase [Gammaproteobacteria bacterium]|nr:PaaI family thioesterase [Gammaproteobacteria bacterium]
MAHAIFDNFPTVFPHCAALGLQVVEHSLGYVKLELQPRPEFKSHSSVQVLHSSVVSSMADSVSGLAAMASKAEIVPLATLDLHVDYLKPASSENTLFAEAECFKRTKNVAFVRGVLWQENSENVVANITASFMLDTANTRRTDV